MKKPLPKTAIIIPVFNEQDSLLAVISAIQEQCDFDIIVVDDASTDNSLALARSIPGIVVLPLRFNIGAWASIQAAMRFALKHGYERVITMDADGQHHASEIASLCNAANKHQNVQVVVGSCTARGSSARRIAWRFFRRVTALEVEDLTSGFRLYELDVLKVLVRRGATLLDYQDIGILLLIHDSGYEMLEVPVSMSPRRAGHSHIYYSWFAVAYYMAITTLLSLAKRRIFAGQYKQKSAINS